MHIVIVIGRFHPYWGGAEIRMKRVAEAMLARGIAVSVLTPRLKRALPQREVIDGIEVVRLPQSRWLFQLAAKHWLSQNRSRIDLVHTIRVDKFGLVGAWANRSLGLPHIADIITNEMIKLFEGKKRKHRKLQAIQSGTTIFHCINQEMARFLQQHGFSDSQIWYRPHAVDIDFFSPNRAPSDNGEITVLYCGRLERLKGSDLLVAAWRLLPAQLRQRAVLQLVGGGKWQARIRAEAIDLPNIIIRDALTKEALAECYRAAQIYVQPSRYEGFGIAIIEAMASGLPVIGTAVGGITDIIEDGVNGFLVPVEDVPALTAALQKLIGDPELRKKMGRAARLRAEQHFSFTNFFEDYEKLYRSMVEIRDAAELRTE